MAAAQRSITPSGVSSPASTRRARSRAESRRSGRESMEGFLLLAHGSKEDGQAKLEIVGSMIQSALSSGADFHARLFPAGLGLRFRARAVPYPWHQLGV